METESSKRYLLVHRFAWFIVAVELVWLMLVVILRLWGLEDKGEMIRSAMVLKPFYFTRAPWTLFTYPFISSDIFNVFQNALMVYFFGTIFVDYINRQHFVTLYLTSFLFAGLGCSLLASFVPFFARYPGLEFYGQQVPAYAILGAITVFAPDDYRAFFIIRTRMKYICLFFTTFLLLGMLGNVDDMALYMGKLLGLLWGFLYIKGLVYLHGKGKATITADYEEEESHAVVKLETTFDKLLEKVARKGYHALTKEEKVQLLEASREEGERLSAPNDEKEEGDTGGEGTA